MNRAPIQLHIDELVLEGFDPVDRHRIADAVERELATVLADGRTHPRLARQLALEPANAGTFTVKNTNATALGRQIARAVCASVFGAIERTVEPAPHPQGSRHSRGQPPMEPDVPAGLHRATLEVSSPTATSGSTTDESRVAALPTSPKTHNPNSVGTGIP